MSTMPDPEGVKIKTEKQADGTWLVKDNTGWHAIATNEGFANAIVGRRKMVIGQTDLM